MSQDKVTCGRPCVWRGSNVIGQAPKRDRPATGSQCRQPVRNMVFAQNMGFAERDDTAALRQNAAATFRGVRLALVRNHTLFAVRYVNLYFRRGFPNLNI